MERQFDIAPARDRAKVLAREVEKELDIPLSSLGAIEKGRITIDETMYNRIHAAIETLAKSRQEARECQQTETMASAAS